MTWKQIEADHPGFKAYCREQFVGNECDSDEYGETQPAKGFGYIADWAERVGRDFGADDAEMLADIRAWIEALEGDPGGRYAGAEQLRPVLARYFDLLWEADEHPYNQEPGELLAWFLEDE